MIETLAGVGLAGLLAFFGWIARTLVAILGRLGNVEQQVLNNGGKSMKDAVDRIEVQGDATGHALQEHLLEAATLTADFRHHVANCSPTVVVNQNQPQHPS